MKVFELLIDEEDENSGISKLSIVKNPATELSWEVFSDDGIPHDCSLHEDLSDKAVELFNQYGVEVSDEAFAKANIHTFAVPPISSNPKAPSFGDDNSDTATAISRYIYVVDTGMGAPLIKTSRQLCRKLILAQRVYSRTDIQNLSQQIAAMGQESFKLVFRPNYINDVDLFEFKAGKNCRHKWTQIDFPIDTNETYEQALSKIPVKANEGTRKGQVLEGGAGRPFISEARYLGMSSDDPYKPIALHFGVLLYSTRFAAMLAEPTAKTISKVKCGNVEGYAPLDIMDEYFEGTAKVVDKFRVKHSFVAIPDYMREAAKRAVDYAEENGWGDCGTDVGKRRASDLADPTYEPSLDILTRMYSYGSRHKKDFESSKSFDDGCGALMMASWSFTPSNYDQAMSWLERQIRNATEENMKFSSDEFRGDITSVVFEPETYIYRYDQDTKTPYYVFMSKDTIRKMLMKLSRLKEMGKITNIINYEHSGMVFKASDVYTYENWIVGDDPKKDKSYEIFGREMKPGTWITTIHFKDKKLFNEFILTNKTTGVSLEGNFFEIPFNFKSEEFIEPKPGQTQDEYIAECIPFMIKEGYADDQAAAICYSKYKERFNCEHEEEEQEDAEMVEGIINLLLQVKDIENRKEILKQVIKDFALEGVKYDYDYLVRKLGITELFAEVGERGGIKESRKAPKSDTPNPNPKGEGTAKGDAGTTRGAEVSARVEEILKEKSDDFNKRYKDNLGYGVNVGMLKAVYQRGVGAYNVSHSPSVKSAEQWALARVNAFLYLVKEGRPENKKYVGDFDLLPTDHPKKEKMEINTDGMIDYLQPDEDDLLDKEIFKPYDWDKCIADQEKAYGSKEIAQRVCGKIRSENMALLGVVEGAPVYPTKDEADQKAKELGCEGSHEMTGYGFAPCKTHSEAAELYNAEILVYLLDDLLSKME